MGNQRYVFAVGIDAVVQCVYFARCAHDISYAYGTVGLNEIIL